MEKLANAKREREAKLLDGEPVDTPDDVRDVIDPLANESAQTEQPADAVEDEVEAQLQKDVQAESGGVDSIVEAAKAMRDGAAPVQARQAAQKVCLIVDDSRVIRKVSTKIAKSLGFVALEAQDGTEALARCNRSMPDLVLTDWDMPEMDGLEFVTRLRAIPTHKPPTVVFCTSKGSAAEIHAGIKAGADDYIVKPFNEATLRAKLERLARG